MGQKHDHERSEFLRQCNFPEFFYYFHFYFFDLFLKIKIKGIEGAPSLSSCALNFSRRDIPPVFQGGMSPSFPGGVSFLPPHPFKPPLFKTNSVPLHKCTYFLKIH